MSAEHILTMGQTRYFVEHAPENMFRVYSVIKAATGHDMRIDGKEFREKFWAVSHIHRTVERLGRGE